uniref:Uncharacterized protein n=1 Tax=Trichogramma kaykai TaxID=54128 RepID=A0ABD2WSF9_9HYME
MDELTRQTQKLASGRNTDFPSAEEEEKNIRIARERKMTSWQFQLEFQKSYDRRAAIAFPVSTEPKTQTYEIKRSLFLYKRGFLTAVAAHTRRAAAVASSAARTYGAVHLSRGSSLTKGKERKLPHGKERIKNFFILQPLRISFELSNRSSSGNAICQSTYTRLLVASRIRAPINTWRGSRAACRVHPTGAHVDSRKDLHNAISLSWRKISAQCRVCIVYAEHHDFPDSTYMRCSILTLTWRV